MGTTSENTGPSRRRIYIDFFDEFAFHCHAEHANRMPHALLRLEGDGKGLVRLVDDPQCAVYYSSTGNKPSEMNTTWSTMVELQGWRQPSVGDNLTREERARYRRRQAVILDCLREIREEEEEALEEFADRQGYDMEDVSERIDAGNAFFQTDAGTEFEKRREAQIEALEEEYLSFIERRFENPAEETKKDRIVATFRAFGTSVNKGALAEAANSSRGYIREFKPYEDISVNDDGGVIRHYHAEGYSHEEGDPPVVLQREPRSQSNTVCKKERSKVLERDGNECLRCGSTADLEIHHIIPVSQGGSDELENLATLCSECHKDARLSNPQERGEICAYPPDKFDAWVENDLDICAARTKDGTPCQNPAGSCPHHD